TPRAASTRALTSQSLSIRRMVKPRLGSPHYVQVIEGCSSKSLSGEEPPSNLEWQVPRPPEGVTVNRKAGRRAQGNPEGVHEERFPAGATRGDEQVVEGVASFDAAGGVLGAREP